MQWLAQLCVRRPVFASVLMLLIVVLGVAGYIRLGARPVPERRPSLRGRDHASRRRRARGGRDRHHRQDRGRGQHHLRHRRAALDLERGRLGRRRSASTSTRTSTSPPKTCATKSTWSSRTLPKGIDPPVVSKLDLGAAPDHARRRSKRPADPRDQRDRRQARSPPDREHQRRRPGEPHRQARAADQRLARTRSSSRRSV